MFKSIFIFELIKIIFYNPHFLTLLLIQSIFIAGKTQIEGTNENAIDVFS